MLSHLHQIFVAAFATLGGLALIFSRKASQPAPDVPATPASVSPVPIPQPASDPTGFTARGAAELVGHEAIVLEWYLDSQKVGTWGIGVTNASGHNVDRYKDNPQPLSHCLEIYIWLLRTKYLPDVLRAFRQVMLSETQLAAALSFHYNTGAIGHASWVALFKEGSIAAARASFMTWDHPSAIVERRQQECDLFFDGKWSGDGKASVIPVLKPSYRPDFRHAERVDIMPALEALLG